MQNSCTLRETPSARRLPEVPVLCMCMIPHCTLVREVIRRNCECPLRLHLQAPHCRDDINGCYRIVVQGVVASLAGVVLECSLHVSSVDIHFCGKRCLPPTSEEVMMTKCTKDRCFVLMSQSKAHLPRIELGHSEKLCILKLMSLQASTSFHRLLRVPFVAFTPVLLSQAVMASRRVRGPHVWRSPPRHTLT